MRAKESTRAIVVVIEASIRSFDSKDYMLTEEKDSNSEMIK